MSKRKMYVITNEFHFVAVVEGPRSPAVSTLYKRFESEYGLTDDTRGNISSAVTIMRRVAREAEAYKRLHDEGLDGVSLRQCFVSWLIKHHGFKRVEVAQFP